MFLTFNEQVQKNNVYFDSPCSSTYQLSHPKSGILQNTMTGVSMN